MTPGPSTPQPAATAPAGPVAPDRIRRYVEQYNGGDCFFITPIAIGASHTTIEGFGASLQPFHKLDDAFKREIGFAADIGVRQVTPQQCPAITFLAGLRDGAARAPRIDIDKTRVRSGETLSGTIERYGNRNVELIAVQPSGQVLGRPLRDGIDAKTFSLSLSLGQDVKQDSVPVLLLAIVSERKLKALDLTSAKAIPRDGTIPSRPSRSDCHQRTDWCGRPLLSGGSLSRYSLDLLENLTGRSNYNVFEPDVAVATLITNA